MAELRDKILSRRQSAEDYLSKKRQVWDVYEKLFHNQLADAISENAPSNVFDPKLSTLTLERAYRVCAQLPTGKVKAISKNDIGSSTLMNLIVDKHVNINANAQFDLLTKFRMVDIYSNIYGNFFCLIDWDVKKNGYIGPDMWLLNVRDVFPQVGAVSVEDSDYIIVRTWKPLSYFENLKENKEGGYTNIDKIVTAIKTKTGSKDTRDANSTSKREDNQYPAGEPAKQKGYFEVLTQYEGDRWVDYCVDAEMEFRDTKNLHENGELPIVCKYAIPLLDDFWGMGDFERGASMQQVVNANWNLYLSAVKMSIFPPIAINKGAEPVDSSLSYIPAAKWLFRMPPGTNVGSAVAPIQLSPQGIATFNNTYQVANGSLLNLFGTTDTATTKQAEVGFGKTPQALEMQQSRENTRDNADRFYMEQFLGNVYKKFVNLISKKQSSAITLRLFDDEIKNLVRSYPEIEQMYDQKTGKVTIDKKITGNITYDYEIVSGSTFALDQKSQQENLLQLLQMFIANPEQGQFIQQLLQEQGYKVSVGEMIKRMFSTSGIQDWDKILIEMTEEEKADSILGAHQQQLQMAMQQVMGGGMNQTPPIEMRDAQAQAQTGQLDAQAQDVNGMLGA